MGLYGSLYDYIIHGCATNYVLASNLLWQCCMCTVLRAVMHGAWLLYHDYLTIQRMQ